jgi:chromatin structure-remodeling complex subunit RSC9
MVTGHDLTVRMMMMKGRRKMAMMVMTGPTSDEQPEVQLMLPTLSIRELINMTGLRQAPPQRVIFQPDTGTSRQSRTSSQTFTPQHVQHSNTPYSSSNPNSMSFGVGNYEPRQPMPLNLRPVVTPGNNPDLFRDKQRALRESKVTKPNARKSGVHKGMMLPGTGFDGPNIYVRTLLALKSGIEEEQAYALHHLVKISHERGDKYKFSAFPGLAEALIEKVLEISQIFYGVKWTVSFGETTESGTSPYLDGVQGTKDLLEKLNYLRKVRQDDEMETNDLSLRLSKINEAGLVLRNMVMLEENANYISRLPLATDFIAITLNLPLSPLVVELQHYALDISEQITKYLLLEDDHPLYVSLVSQLDNSDRGAILTALRAIGRIAMNLEESNRLSGVPLRSVSTIIEWTVLDDEELVSACLDFLYQYTALEENVQNLVENMNENTLAGLVNRLVQLLTFGSKQTEKKTLTKSEIRQSRTPDSIPVVPEDLLQELLAMEEPQRSTQW